ncbi:MAG: hypothetical protein H6737_31715 [Alphaproteobacteria bacterium]|nr:hypothetical protein [Alphaproteobacteria bacterium]
MRRAVIGVSFVFLLGCSGIAEGLAELISGSEIEVDGDRVVLTNPDGSTQVITQGENASLPADFPLPAPPGDIPIDSVVDSDDGGPRTVSYRLRDADDANAIVAFYSDWFVAEGIEVASDHQNLAGMRTAAMVGSRDGVVLAVTFTDALGTRMLSLSATPAR